MLDLGYAILWYYAKNYQTMSRRCAYLLAKRGSEAGLELYQPAAAAAAAAALLRA